MKNIISLLTIVYILIVVLLPSCKRRHRMSSDEKLMKTAQDICQKRIIIDSHIDWPEWVLNISEDISQQTLKGDFDIDRANK